MYRFDDVRLSFEPGTADDIAARVVAIDLVTGRHAEGEFTLPLDADELAADLATRGAGRIERSGLQVAIPAS